jgi:uncharacterized protein YjbJ (UPF0337 family)
MNIKIKSLLLSVAFCCMALAIAWSGAIIPTNSIAQAAPFSNSLADNKPIGKEAVENARSNVKKDTEAGRNAPSDVSDNIEGKGFPEVRTEDLSQQDPLATSKRAKELAARERQQINNKEQLKEAGREVGGKAKQVTGQVKSTVDDATSKAEDIKDDATSGFKSFFKR